MAKKIMIVDDDPIIVKYLTSLFNDNGYETCTASGSTEGLEVLKNEKPDMITLDLDMPEEWGPRFYRRLSKDKAFKDTPVIVISGVSGGHHAIKKAAAFLSKPFDKDKLLGIVKSTIDV